MSFADLLSTFDRLARPRVLVVGDLILDRYTFGNAERVSQEAPVILLRADQRESRLGGAANVSNMLRGLEARVACAGVVGADAEGALVRQLLAEAGVEVDCLLTDRARPTTVKERFIGRAQGRHPHQMLRVDSEVREPIAAAVERELIEALRDRLSEADMVLISDYDKGVCTPSLLRALIDACRAAGVPVIVDPIRGHDYSRYRGATTMTPNRLEAEMATGLKILSTDDALAAARMLRQQLQLALGIVTLDRDGMALIGADGGGVVVPTRPRAVYDVTGAGDMALAMIGVALAARLSAVDALRLANIAAGLEVEKVGVAVIPRAEIRQRLVEEQSIAQRGQAGALPHRQTFSARDKVVTLDELALHAKAHRAAGQRIVFTNGCFDLLHIGHVTYLAEARALGDLLVVGVNSDDSVRRLKGPTRPVIGQSDRAGMLAALAAVDYVLIFDDETPHAILHRLRPEVLVKGGTYTPEQVVGHEVVAAYGGRVCVAGLVEGISTTNILKSVGGSILQGPHFARSSPPVRSDAA
ncbi:MAG TPA: D-glycero-beta-D-manno-heptose 1-phosphate adenylyltransferase [Pirellulales bacterium]